MQERMIRNDCNAIWSIQYFEEKESTIALSIKQVAKPSNDSFSADFDDAEFQAIGDYCNQFVNEKGELDKEALMKATEFILKQY